MRCSRLAATAALWLAALSAARAAAQDAAKDRLPEFTVRSLSTLEFGEPLIGGVNDKGSAFGTIASRDAKTQETRHDAFFRDRHGDRQPLGHLPGGSDRTTPWDINEHDWVVGSSNAGKDRYGHDRAFAWNGRDGLIDLGTLGGTTSVAEGVNDHNQVVGYSDTPGERRAFLWEPGKGMRVLGVPGGSRTSTAHDISNKGTVAGHTYLSGGAYQHANLWTRDGRFVGLGDLPGGTVEAAAFAVNEKDHAVGYSITDAGHRAFFWSEETGMINLGAIPGTTEGSVAHDINNRDWVVGTSRNPGPTSTGRPFLWTQEWGLRNLNDLLDGDDRRAWKLYQASWVNDHGDILAVGQRGDEYHIVLLTVSNPEPGGLVMLAGALAPLLRRTPRPPFT